MTITECFQKSLYENRDFNNEFPVIYEKLMVKLISPESCEEILRYMFDDYCKNNKEWFYSFHKSIRQSDFYGNTNTAYNMCYPNPFITEEEKLERKKLLEFKHQKRLELGSDYITNTFNKEYSEYAKRIGELNEKFSNKKIVSIEGHLDVILHAMISSDNNFLKNKLENCFEDYKHYQSKKEKGLI